MQTPPLGLRLFIPIAFLILLEMQLAKPAKAGHGGSFRAVGGKIRFGRKSVRRSSSEETIAFLELEEHRPTITTTINNVYNAQTQHPPVGIESSTTTTATSSARSKTDEHVSTYVAGLAKDFEQALVAVNANHYDLHIGNLLLACGRLENTMKQIGFKQSANDISGNVQKIRNVYNFLPNEKRDSISAIVRYEFETGVHGSIGTNRNSKGHHTTLEDSSATVGFLWLGRSINYQYDMFRRMLDHEDETPYNAAKYAYEKALKPHLSWPLQKICQAAMKRLKPLQKNELFCRIGGFREESYGCQEDQATKRDLRRVVDFWQPMLNRWKQTLSDLELAGI